MNSTLAISEAAQRRVFFDQQLAEERSALTAAESDMKATQERTGLIQLSGQAESIIRSIAELEAQISSREVQLQAARTFATDQNPDIVRLQQEIAALRRQLVTLQDDQQRLAPGDTQLPAGRVPGAGLEYARKLREVKYCYRYSKIPQIRRLKIPQVWADRRHSDPWGCGCCDWRVLWRYRSCITTA
jgi:capsule polysaccharide export protein KpsE/RkpR